MDFAEQVKQLSQRVSSMKDSIRTEEATKTSIIMPFFAMLGYDIFNPNEFTPEFVADVGIKKGEKVDYAILKDGEPVILIEAKAVGKKLERHDSQLFRYFGTTRAKFAILTNGILYRFYTDIDERNKMDKEPFLELNLLRMKEEQIAELKKFHKDCFCVEDILDTAAQLKYERSFKALFSQQLQNPGDDFVRIFLKEAYSGPKTQVVIERFRPILKKSLNDYITELLSEKILSALENQEEKEPGEEEAQEDVSTATDDEMEAFFLVKTILRGIVDVRELYGKKTDSYFVVLYQNNSRKWVCRLVFNSAQKYLILPKGGRQTIRYAFASVNDMMDYKNQLIEAMKRYLDPQEEEQKPPQEEKEKPKPQENTAAKEEEPQPEPVREEAEVFETPDIEAAPKEPYRVRIYPRPPRAKRILPNKHLRRV